MENAQKRMVLGSMAAAGLVALLAILDLVLGIPFAGGTSTAVKVMDILFLIGAGLVAYMAWDAYQDLT